MAKLKIEINLDNAAFDEPYLNSEVALILNKVANKLYNENEYPSVIRDSNGNKVGFVKLEEDEEDED